MQAFPGLGIPSPFEGPPDPEWHRPMAAGSRRGGRFPQGDGLERGRDGIGLSRPASRPAGQVLRPCA